MGTRRLEYITVLLACFAYYLASGEWLSLALLVTAAGVPVVSVLMSLPALLTCRVVPETSGSVPAGTELYAGLRQLGPMPALPVRGRLRLQGGFGRADLRLRPEDPLPTEHCGGWQIRAERVRVYDYLGLFAFPARRGPAEKLTVTPLPLAPAKKTLPGLREPDSWVPKRSGGFSENSEHRDYRPGDPMNRVHWKLSAKKGSWIVREPMEPAHGTAELCLSLTGTPEELDRKLGRLLWTGQLLLSRGLDLHVRALTGGGVLELKAADDAGLSEALRVLLYAGKAPEEPAGWRESGGIYLGGEPDES